MPTQYKTQCPRCKTIYPLPHNKRDNPKARANCGKCHHTFFLNANLITESDEPSAPVATQAPTATQTPVVPQPVVAPKVVTPTPTAPQPTPQATAPKPTANHSAMVSAQQAVAAANAAKQTASISARSSQTIANLIKEKPELSTPHTLPKTPSDTPVKKVAETANFDGLDDFLSDTASPASTTKQPIPKESAGDALDELLTGNIKTATAPKNTTSHPTPTKKETTGNEFDHIPAVSANATLDRQELQKRAVERLAAQSPSQEKMSKSRGVLGHLMWVFGSLVLLALMAVQYVIFNADAIAKRPNQAQLVYTVCASLSCNLPKADPNAFSNAYEIQVGKNNGTNLVGTLKNNSGDDQLYPNLKISVQGHDKFIGDFVVSPQNYLTTPQRLLGANQGKRYMFTLPTVNPQEISKVQIEPFY